MSLMTEVGQKAFNLGVPIAVHMDVTYRCNERCVHCYLDHDDHGEMTTEEIKGVLDQLAEAGVFFLTFSGGEVFMRRDFFELVEHARRLMFNVKIKTNAVMIHEEEARRIRALGVDTIQISVYSHRPEVHDAITKLPHSFERTVQSIRFLREQGLRVTIANVLMTANYSDHAGVQELAAELDAQYTLDPTITPMMDGDTSVLALRIPGEELRQVFTNPALVENQEEFCAPPKAPSEADLEGYSCSAGHSFCYISPYGDVFPCVQFPLPTGNLRQQKFLDIWNFSPQMQEDLLGRGGRGVRVRASNGEGTAPLRQLRRLRSVSARSARSNSTPFGYVAYAPLACTLTVFPGRNCGETEPGSCDRVARRDRAAVGRPADTAAADPAPAPEHTPGRARSRIWHRVASACPSAGNRNLAEYQSCAPLPHVAVHVIQPEAVGLNSAHAQWFARKYSPLEQRSPYG